MLILELSLILSIIGCVTGVASLLINFYKILIERSKLDVKFHDELRQYFDKLENLSSFDTKFQGFVYITFVNKSSLPITIYGIDTFCNNKQFFHRKYDEKNIELVTDFYSNNYFTETKRNTYEMSSQVVLPLKLEPFSAFSGFMFFQVLPDVIEETQNIDFTIKTTRKTLKRSCSINKFETRIHNDRNY